MLSERFGKRAIVKKPLLLAYTLVGFALQDLQQQRQLGHFHGLGVDVHAEDVRRQDTLLFADRESPMPVAGVFVDGLLVFSGLCSMYHFRQWSRRHW